MLIALAPMEGLVDSLLRDILSRSRDIDWCVSEFVRVTDQLLTAESLYRKVPELKMNSRTASRVPVHVQLMGNDPICMADNAALIAGLGAEVIDLNFGCPARTVNNSNAGAALLKQPYLLYRITREIRNTLPENVRLTAKMRLGYESPDPALDCALALEDGGVSRIVVHARTRMEGFRPPAHWEWVGKIAEAVRVPVMGNGEIWNIQDYQKYRMVSGVDDVMLGRGLVSCPDLARQITDWAGHGDSHAEMGWDELRLLVREYWERVRGKMILRYAAGRLKQWLKMLASTYPEAETLFSSIRSETDISRLAVKIASL